MGLGLAVVPFLPRRCILALSRALGNLGFSLCAKLRGIALANLDCAYRASLNRNEKVEIARESFRTFVLVVLDLFWFSVFTSRRISRWVKYDTSFNEYFNSKPAIAVTGHLGNWEIMGLAASFRGHPSLSVFAPLANPVATHVLTKLRSGTGQMTASKHGAVRAMLENLKAGGRVAVLVDQNTLPSEGGEFVSFFDLPAPVSRVAASLSGRTGAVIVPTYCVSCEDGMYELRARPGFKCRDGAISETVQAVTRELELIIRKHPGQWLWMYKRWKHVPEGADINRYPGYAKRQ